MPPANLLITRPQPGASDLEDALRARFGADDLNIVCSPLMQITFDFPAPDLSDIKTLIFTSQNGVTGFARHFSRRDLPAYAVGDTTADVAREHGFEVRSAGGDIHDLVALLKGDGVTGPCLHLRGTYVAGDMITALAEIGIAARQTVVYDQVTLALNAAARDLLARDQPVIVPLFSPRSVTLFFAAGPFKAPLHVIAISQNAADAVPEGAARSVFVTDRPDGAHMLNAVLAELARTNRVEGGNRAQ